MSLQEFGCNTQCGWEVLSPGIVFKLDRECKFDASSALLAETITFCIMCTCNCKVLNTLIWYDE